MFDNDDWAGVHFVPVPLVGARHRFEMCAEGLVRKSMEFLEEGECRWLSPHNYSLDDPTLVYRLEIFGRERLLTVAEVFAFYGKVVVPAGWEGAVKREVRRLNQMEWEQRTRAGRLHEAAEDGAFCTLPEHIIRECPWQGAHVRGDCQGADPVLGF